MALPQIEEIFVHDFLNEKVKGFAQYVIESRAIPNIMDGLRIGARKIIYSAITGDLGKKETVKMPELIGDTFKNKFHHGDASLKNTIEQLSMRHNFEYCPLHVLGQISTLRSTVTTAARYLEVEKSKFIDLFLTDKNLWDLKFEEGSYTEPKYFYPIIPIQLLWRTNSPGYGFGYRSFSFDIDDIINATINTINNNNCYEFLLKPSIFGIKPENIVYNYNKNNWYNVAEYKLDFQNDVLLITDLPFNHTFDGYREHLYELKSNGYIKSYEDRSNIKGINISIKFYPGRLRLLSNEKWKFFNTMKLYAKIPKLNLNSLDTNGKTILNFDTPNDLIATFVRKRKLIYQTRKTNSIKQLEDRISILEDRIKFIQLILDNKLIINKRKIIDIKKDLDNFKVSYEGLKLPISRLTEDEIEKSNTEIRENYDLLNYYKITTIEQMYVNDLIELKEKYRNTQIINVGKIGLNTFEYDSTKIKTNILENSSKQVKQKTIVL